MGLYSNKGLLNSYKRNHKEREELDYYSSPPNEVLNILEILGYDFTNKSILEPCCGGGHMIAGIQKYLDENNQKPKSLQGTDFKDRDFRSNTWQLQYGLDFLADDYPIAAADVIAMNPPYATLEPFLIRALEIAQEKLIVLCRMQATEGSSRYENIYKNNPPTDIYQYIERIQCWKGGKKPTGSSAQGYCWLVWDKTKDSTCGTQFHWLHRSEEY